MQSYRKSDSILCGAKIFNGYNCMCTDQFTPSFHFHPGSYLQVGTKYLLFHTRIIYGDFVLFFVVAWIDKRV